MGAGRRLAPHDALRGLAGALFLLVLIVIDVQAGYAREWARVTGITVFALAIVIVPTGGLRWLRLRAGRARKTRTGAGSQ